MIPKSSRFTRLTFCLALTLLTACTTQLIPGTTVVDTPNNRTILDIVRNYKNALEQRNFNPIIAMCSQRYYEDNGNNDTSDDYGYKELKEKVLPDIFKHLDNLQIDLEVKEINVDLKKNYASADFKFFYRAKMTLPSGEKWNADTEINRLEFTRENNEWKITSGL